MQKQNNRQQQKRRKDRYIDSQQQPLQQKYQISNDFHLFLFAMSWKQNKKQKLF